MKVTHIMSRQLPGIDQSVKECINAGQWFLFKANTEDAQVFFFLKVEKDIFALDEYGEVLTSFPLNDEIRMEEFIYFEDIPKPESLSHPVVTTH